MTWLWLALVVAVIGAAAALAASRWPIGAPGRPDREVVRLPSRPLTDDDLATLRFTQSLRGYSMDEVDDVIERLRAELAARPSAAAPVERSGDPLTADREPGR